MAKKVLNDTDGDYCINQCCRDYAGHDACYFNHYTRYKKVNGLIVGNEVKYRKGKVRDKCTWLNKNRPTTNA